MNLLLICSDASAASLTSNLLWAMEARSGGESVAVLFSAEALAAFSDGVFLWPRELSKQTTRLTIADSAKAQELPLMLRGEARQLHVLDLVTRAQEAGVPIYADPVWTDLLGLRGKLPDGIQELDRAGGLKMLGEAKTVIGGL